MKNTPLLQASRRYHEAAQLLEDAKVRARTYEARCPFPIVPQDLNDEERVAAIELLIAGDAFLRALSESGSQFVSITRRVEEDLAHLRLLLLPEPAAHAGCD